VPVTPSEEFLVKKAGPLPVWLWGLIGLAVAYLYSKYKAGKASATPAAATTATPAGEPGTGSPYFVIEDNSTGGMGHSHSQPVSPPPTTTPPTTTPPGTTTTIPVMPVGPEPSPVGPLPVPAQPVTTSNPAAPTTRATYTVVPGDTLSKIAAKFGTTAAAIFAYNTTPGVRPAATEAKLLQQGPNLIYAGQQFLIPS
jgi:nucleoid-associated protein YgaU